MKILFVNNFKGRGGGEEFLRDLLPGLAAKGAKVGLICRPNTPLVDMFRNSEITLHPIRRSGLSTISAVFKTAKVIKDGEYEIVDIQRGHDIIQSWLGAKLSRRNPALMYTPQVPEFIRSRFLLSRMKKIVTISRHIRDRIIAYFPKIARRTSIIYYGIDLDKFKPGNIRRGAIRSRFGLPPDTRIIGTVGDLWKNQVEFLDSLVLIRKEIPGACFALVASESGTGQIEVFKQRAAKLGLTEAILWTGRLSKEDMLSFYADIDIAVSTHRNEGFGIWVLEALAVGTPIVSVNEGGIRDSLEGCPSGVLVDNGPETMAAEVIRILKDSSLYVRMASAGPRWTADRFSRGRMIDDYFRFFQSLLVKKHSNIPRVTISTRK
jgi:glycosyltransferase involved in cell wall biosynthesis